MGHEREKIVDLAASCPPEELTVEQRAIWREVVRSMPPRWWSGANRALLTEYVRTIDLCQRYYEQLWSVLDTGDVELITKLTKLYQSSCLQLARLARAQRLAHDSRYDRRGAASMVNAMPSSPPPWGNGVDGTQKQ